MNPRTKEFKDYYKVLGIGETAGDAEIRKAFRKLALEFHPDHHPDDPGREEKFKVISEAYGVLIHPEKRREYDRYRTAYFSGTGGSFNYSQQDIFESLFRDGFARGIFEELNREFRRSGFRSGNPFFHAIFFGGAVGDLGRILSRVPGPIGKIGQGLRLAQWVGASILAARAKQPPAAKTGAETPGWLDSLKGSLLKTTPSAGGGLHLTLPVAPEEAKAGTKKKIAYKVEGVTEELLVHIPPGFPPGGKLRIPDKGRTVNGKRGDLLLTVSIPPSDAA